MRYVCEGVTPSATFMSDGAAYGALTEIDYVLVDDEDYKSTTRFAVLRLFAEQTKIHRDHQGEDIDIGTNTAGTNSHFHDVAQIRINPVKFAYQTFETLFLQYKV